MIKVPETSGDTMNIMDHAMTNAELRQLRDALHRAQKVMSRLTSHRDLQVERESLNFWHNRIAQILLKEDEGKLQ
jgi:hypothetical protein